MVYTWFDKTYVKIQKLIDPEYVELMSEKPKVVVDIKFDPTLEELRKRVVASEDRISKGYDKFQKIMLEHAEW